MSEAPDNLLGLTRMIVVDRVGPARAARLDEGVAIVQIDTGNCTGFDQRHSSRRAGSIGVASFANAHDSVSKVQKQEERGEIEDVGRRIVNVHVR